MVNRIIDKIKDFKNLDGTEQSWRKDNAPIYENEYIKLIRIDSSNVHGGYSVKKESNGAFFSNLRRTLNIYMDGEF